MTMHISRFTVKGFRNFRNPITIDFTDVRDYRFNQECIDDGIIMKMGIYGPNGSGKSNLGIALFNIVSYLTDLNYNQSALGLSNFLNVDEKTYEAVFRYEFINNEDEYIFEYHKSIQKSFLRELLIVNGKMVYDYDFTRKEFMILNREGFIGYNLNFEYLNGNISIMKYIANNAALEETSPVRHIMDFVYGMLWFNPSNGVSLGIESMPLDIDGWIISNGYLDDFNAFLHDVCNIDVELSAVTTLNNSQILAEKHDNGMLIFKQVCSSGTSAAELFYFWLKRFNRISFLFMDEFDAYYHFELAEKIISIIKTYPDMQMIFTTHNTTLMGNNILRPDCYFFLDKGLLKSYVDRAESKEIREGHNLEKIYRNGGLRN